MDKTNKKDKSISEVAALALAEQKLKANPDKEIRLIDYVKDIPAIEQIINSYPEDLRDNLTLTQSQLLQLIRFSQDRVFGMAQTVPLHCKGEECDFADICLYYKLQIAPVDYPCPEEVDLVTRMVPQLIQDLEIDSESYVELNMVQEYVDSIIQEHRAQKYLALTNDIVPRTIAIDPTTALPVYQDDFAPALITKEKALKKKERLRKELVATREARLKFKIAKPEDESKKAADLRRRAEAAIKKDKIEDIEYEEVE